MGPRGHNLTVPVDCLHPSVAVPQRCPRRFSVCEQGGGRPSCKAERSTGPLLPAGLVRWVTFKMPHYGYAGLPIPIRVSTSERNAFNHRNLLWQYALLTEQL